MDQRKSLSAPCLSNGVRRVLGLFISGCVLLTALVPLDAWAQEPLFNVFHVDTTKVSDSAIEKSEGKAEVTFSFAALDNLRNLVDLKEDGFSVGLTSAEKDEEVEVKVDSMTLRKFKDSERTIAVMIVMPGTFAYFGSENPDEDDYAIKGEVARFVSRLREQDLVGVYAYSATGPTKAFPLLPRKSDGKGRNSAGLATNVRGLLGDAKSTPDFYDALDQSAKLLQTQGRDADVKFLVAISDGEGAQPSSTEQITAITSYMESKNIRPIIINYPPKPVNTGSSQLSYVFPHGSRLKQMAKSGLFIQSKEGENFKEFKGAMNQAFSYVYGQLYQLDVVFNVGEEWIDPGKYKFTLTTKDLGDDGVSSTIEGTWPEVSQSYLWILWLILSIIGGLILIWLLVLLIRKIRDREPEEEIEHVGPIGPEEVFCETCGKRIPDELYGFVGEFCLEGGVPDCPYYQPPDRGRLHVFKGGAISGTTFFIKDEITTIGSLIGENTSVLLRDNTVSKKHAAVKVDDGNRYELRDFASTNGTFVNGERVQRKFLKDGDKISFGTVEVEFTLK